MTRMKKTGIGVTILISGILATWWMLHDSNGVKPATPHLLRDMESVKPDCGFKITRKVVGLLKPRTASDTVLQQARAKSNAADVYRMIFELMNAKSELITRLKELTRRRNYSELSQSEKDELRNLLESPEARDILELLQAAANKDNCDWNLDYTDGFNLSLPHVDLLRGLVDLAVGAAFVANDKGDVWGACELIELGLKTSGNLGEKDTIVSGLVQISCDKRMLDCLGAISQNPVVPENQEYAILVEIARRDYGEGMVAAARRETYMVTAILDKLAAGETPATAFGNFFEHVPEFMQRITDTDTEYIVNNMAKYKELSERFIELLALPYDNDVKERNEKLNKELAALPADEFGLAKFFLPVFPGIIAKAGEATFGLDTTFTDVATVIYRSRYGRNPESIADLREVLDRVEAISKQTNRQ